MMFNLALTIYLTGVVFVLWNLYEIMKEHYDETRYMNKMAFILTIMFMASCSWLIILYCLFRKGERDE